MSYERRKIRLGSVVSANMDKTIVVTHAWSSRHPIYKKLIRRESRLMTHDPENRAKVGDVVRVVECRPISKKKRWTLKEILSSKEIATIQPDQIQIDDSVTSAAATSAAEEAEITT